MLHNYHAQRGAGGVPDEQEWIATLLETGTEVLEAECTGTPTSDMEYFFSAGTSYWECDGDPQHARGA